LRCSQRFEIDAVAEGQPGLLRRVNISVLEFDVTLLVTYRLFSHEDLPLTQFSRTFADEGTKACILCRPYYLFTRLAIAELLDRPLDDARKKGIDL
jgi:hypothetical protein